MMRNNESGFTLIGVLAVFTIISVFGISLVMLSISSVKTSNTEHDDQSVFYIAEAGANYMMNEIEQEAHNTYKSKDFTSTDDFYTSIKNSINEGSIVHEEDYKVFEPNESRNPEAKIHVERVSESNPVEYKITSVGTIGDQSRKVARTIAIDWPSDGDNDSDSNGGGDRLLPPFAMFTYGKDIDLKENINIIGNIGTAASGNNDVKIHKDVNLDKIDAIFLPKPGKSIIKYEGNFDEDKKSGKVVIMNDIPNSPSPPTFPRFPSTTNNKSLIFNDGNIHRVTLKEDISSNNINLNNNSTIEFDIGNENRTVIIENLDVKSGHINIIGNGTLHLYINKHSKIDNNSTINFNGKTDQLNMYSKGKIDLLDNSILKSSIHIEHGDLTLKSSSELYGNVFVDKGNLHIQDQSTIHSEIILVPNSMVKLNNANIKGPIIADKFQMHGGSLDHRPPFTLTGPLSFGNLGYDWPDLGQGNAENGGNPNGNLPKPPNGPITTASPIKEIQ